MFGNWGRRKASGALEVFEAVPPPAKGTPVGEIPMLAVDIETTGLKPGKDQLLSIGWVPITGGVIELAGAQHHVLSGAGEVGDSATIHGLTDDMIAQGKPVREVLDSLLFAMQGRAMLAHYASIEMGFLSHACEQLYDAPLRIPVVDTFALERRHMERMGTYPRGEDLRLARVRRRYGLPDYHSHNALTDALACAELYLAMDAQSNWNTLRDLAVG